jgi:hypothetical protein
MPAMSAGAIAFEAIHAGWVMADAATRSPTGRSRCSSTGHSDFDDRIAVGLTLHRAAAMPELTTSSF